MIRAFTGLPGHGKTLRVVAELLEARAKDDARPLYVRGIRGLKVDHAVIEGPDWARCPDGSLIIIDEAQEVFPVRRGGDVPAFIQELATHRHRGIDIWIVTQHPALVDSFVRRLVDRHTHVFRISGAEVAQVYEWGEIQEDPRAMSSREVSEAHTWKFPREVFGAYDSAVMHTAKARIPKKLVYLVAAVALFGLCITWLIGWGKSRMGGETALNGPIQPSIVESALAPTPQRTIATPEQWLEQFTPRVAHRPESAPAYDRMMAAAEPPKLYCIDVELAGCRCYTDQGTIWKGVDQGTCRDLARNGILRVQMGRR